MQLLERREDGDFYILKIEASPDRVKEVADNHFAAVSKSVVVDGFRKGHAPMPIVMKTLGNRGRLPVEYEKIVNKVIDLSVFEARNNDKSVEDAIFGMPIDKTISEFNADSYKLVFEVYFEKCPVIKLGDYSAINTLIEHKEPNVSICPMPKQGEASDKDIVALFMVGKDKDDRVINKYTYDMIEIDLEVTKIRKEIIEAVLGSKSGDVKNIEFKDGDLDVKLEIKVRDVREKREVNEELLKELNFPEGTTIEKMQEFIKKQHDIHNHFVKYHDVIKWILSSENTLEHLPIRNLKHESGTLYKKLIQQGHKNISLEGILVEHIKNLKSSLVINEIAKVEKIETTDSDKEAFVKDIEDKPWLYGNQSPEKILNTDETTAQTYVLQFKVMCLLMERWIFSS